MTWANPNTLSQIISNQQVKFSGGKNTFVFVVYLLKFNLCWNARLTQNICRNLHCSFSLSQCAFTRVITAQATSAVIGVMSF